MSTNAPAAIGDVRCPQCSSLWPSQPLFERHRDLVHGTNVCPDCPVAYVSSLQLRMHRQREHGLEQQPPASRAPEPVVQAPPPTTPSSEGDTHMARTCTVEGCTRKIPPGRKGHTGRHNRGGGAGVAA